MKIEDAGEVGSFETMPTERNLYMTAVQYGGGSWIAGPSGYDKEEVIRMVSSYTGVTNVRIYTVKVPVKQPGE